MPLTNHAPAIIRWREDVENNGGLDAFDKSSTVSTMLFGCLRCLQNPSGTSDPDQMERIERIRSELEAWMKSRNLAFTG